MEPIDPKNIVWDTPPQPVGVPPTGSAAEPLRGGVIIPARPEKPETPPVATPTRETERFRTMSPQEVAAEGTLDPTKAYQINQAGKIELIGGGAAGAVTPKTAATNLLLAAGVDPETGLDPVADLIKGSTSGGVRAWIEKNYGAITGEATPGMENISRLKTIVSDMTLQLTGGSLGAGVSNADVTFLKERVGNLADPTVPANERLAAWNEVKARLQRVTGATAGQPPGVPPPAAGAQPPDVYAPIEAGQLVQTEADLAAERQLQSAWDSGASVDQMVALMQQLGRGAFEPAAIQQMQNARAKGERVRMYATPTGKPTAFEEQVTGAMATPVGQAAGGAALGAANALTLGMIDELAPVLGLSSEQVQAAKNYYRQEAPIASFTGEVAGAVGASVPFVRGAQAALAGTRLAGAAPLIGEAIYGAGYGAGEAPEDQRLMGAVIGGGAGAAGGALANRFLPGGPGTFTGIAPELPPAGRFAGPALPPSEIVAAGREAGVPVMTSDINPPQTFMGRVGQQVSEIVPFGTAGMRRGQQEARERAVEDLLAETNVTLDRDIATDIVQNLKETRGKEIDKWNDMKTNVIEKYTTAGDVAAPKSLDAIDSLIAKLQGENLPRQLGGLIQQLNDVKTSLSGPGNLQKIEANRKTLFELKKDTNLAAILTKSEKAFQQVYKALNDDMGDFIKTTGNNKDFTRWKVANTKLAMMAGELRQGGLKRVLDQGEFNPQTVTGMLTSTNPQEAKLLYNSLGSAGRANARLLLLQSAAKKALDPNTGVINPNTFAREANKLKSNFGQFFSGAEANRVQGLVAVLNATRRAQESQFAPRTGERMVPYATAGSFGWLGTLLGFDPITGLASSAGVGAAARLYESAATRDMLMRIGKATGSEKARLISDFTQRMAAAAAPVAAVGAANMNEPSGAPEGAIIVGPPQ